jgi:hypothetical protein
MQVIQTESWTPTVAKPTISYQVGAGVTPRVSVQVTNNTLGEVLLLDSAQPPLDKQQAKYVIPPRCTATYPLDSATLAARWTGLVDSGESIEFVFSDSPVTPQVWPGTIPTGGSTAPVQSVMSTLNDKGTWPVTLTTQSGLNIGQVYVFNNTSMLWLITITSPFFKYIYVRPRTWITIPMNQPSGTVTLNHIYNLDALLQYDTFYAAWSDINYLVPFPSGASSLPSPIINPEAARVAELPTRQFYVEQAITNTGGGTVDLYTLSPKAGTAIQRIVITYCHITHIGGVSGANTTLIEVSGGFDGLGGTEKLLQASFAYDGANPRSPVMVERNDPVVITNLSTTAANIIRVRGVWGGSYIRGDGGIAGYRLS